MPKDKDTSVYEAEVIDEELNQEESDEFLVKRVDFSDPYSIRNYGSEIVKETANLTLEVSNSDKLGIKGLMRKAAYKALSVIGKEDLLPVFDPKKTHEEYIESLRVIAQNVEKDLAEAEKAIDIKQAFIKNLEPLIQQLEEYVKVGEEDLEAFKEDIKIRESKVNSSLSEYDNLKLLNEIKSDKQAVIVFEMRLGTLRKHLALTQNSKASCNTEILNDTKRAIAYNEYLDSMLPALEQNATLKVEARVQKLKIDKHQKLLEKSNKALKDTSNEILENTKRVNDMFVSGAIYNDTIKTLAENISKGNKLLIEGNKQKLLSTQEGNKIVTALQQSYQESVHTAEKFIGIESNQNSEDVAYLPEGPTLSKRRN